MSIPRKRREPTYTHPSSLLALTRAIRRMWLHTAQLEALCTHLALRAETTGRFGLDGLRAIEAAEREQSGMTAQMPGQEAEQP